MEGQLLKGNTATLVLSILNHEPTYGYKLIKKISLLSNNLFDLKEGTLYPILHKLEQDGLVTSYWAESESGRMRKYYKITPQGIKALDKDKSEWLLFKKAVDRILEGEVAP